MKLTDIEVKGRKFSISVTDQGKFYADLDGDQVHESTLDNLKSTLSRRMAVARVKVNIPFVRWGKYESLMRGTVTGIHAANKTLLVKFDGGKTNQERYWQHDGNYIKPEVADQLAALGKARDEASDAYNKFVKEHSFDPAAKIREQFPQELEDANE